MASDKNSGDNSNRIKKLEKELSALRFKQEETQELLESEKQKSAFYQRVADFSFGWELWFNLHGNIEYCSPSCYELTGYTANQLIDSPSVTELVVYEPDREKFEVFFNNALKQNLINPSHEFRIMTRTRQLRWCLMNIRGVYNLQGRYLGIRASIQDITKLKRALGHINDLSAGKELENRNKERLKSKLEMKERELVAFLLQLSQKNELLHRITRQLNALAKEGTETKSERIQKLLQLLENQPDDTLDWDMVEVQLEKLHPGFMSRLLLKHSKLTAKDKKLCACLKLGLTSKEIAGLNNLTPQSVEIARVRLRKKLKLPHHIRLASYLTEV